MKRRTPAYDKNHEMAVGELNFRVGLVEVTEGDFENGVYDDTCWEKGCL